MAKSLDNTTTGSNNTFNSGIQEDINNLYLKENDWTQARNAINNSKTGDLGSLGNEPATLYCTSVPYTMVGAVHMFADAWVVFSTDNTNSEIGLFLEGRCSYRTVVNDPCLKLSQSNLITGVSKESSDCTWQVYFADGLNPDRVLNVGNPENWPTIPYLGNNYYQGNVLWPGVTWNQTCVTDPNNCITCTDINTLNCDGIRLANLLSPICLNLNKGASGGELLNGSYFVVGAYTIDQQKIGDYFQPSNVQALFSHENVAGSLDITVNSIDTSYDEFELILVSFINQQTIAKRVGYYSTRSTLITLDIADPTWNTVPIEEISLANPIVDKSDAIYENNNYLLRVGPTSKLDFNYQPLANQIKTEWNAVEYPANYYFNGGNNTSYLRDEVYAFFIRWVYNTGDKSASYHIPGRAATAFDLQTVGGNDAYPEIQAGLTPYRWIVRNTALASATSGIAPDGVGSIIAKGRMAYWESTENYDDDRPEVWNANIPGHPEWDLCGKKIRHHKFPDNCTDSSSNDQLTNHFSPGGLNIRIMGVKFSNIKPPVDLSGNIITNITGYEILRGTREGNRSIIAKGMLNNMYEYDIPNTISSKNGLYPNYPYNPSGDDYYINTVQTVQGLDGPTSGTDSPNPASNRNKTYFTFHSPETQFKRPFLSAKEIKIYGELNAQVNGQFIEPSRHPKHKLITNLAFFISLGAAIGIAVIAMNGKRRTRTLSAKSLNLGVTGIAPADLGVSFLGYSAGYPITVAGIDAAAFDAAGMAAGNTAGVTSDVYYAALYGALATGAALPGTTGFGKDYEEENAAWKDSPQPLKTVYGLPTFLHYFAEGVDTFLEFWYSVLPYRQYALQYVSHGFYNEFICPVLGNKRRIIEDAVYLGDGIQELGNFRINNTYRNKSVAIQIDGTYSINDTQTVDDTRKILATVPFQFPPVGYETENKTTPFITTAASHYVALKQRIRNQYGQIEGIRQVPVSTCPNPVVLTPSTNPNTVFSTDVLFNGDTYVARYTEKNTMFFFFDWLYDQPDGYEFNYDTRDMLPHARYWADFEKFGLDDFVEGVATAFSTMSIGALASAVPSSKFCLDRASAGAFRFGVKNAYFYLFNSGVRDFFVETEINIAYRDWNDNDAQRHYDPYNGYTDYENTIFNTAIIKSGNFYKYDSSLSISKLYNNYISWGNVQSRSYDPATAQDCYVYNPNRVIYSLPEFTEGVSDGWLIFLPNDYKDFKSRVTAIKPINKNGALMFFENESPVQFLGVDQLETDAGTKITIGDGGLFSQPLQNLANADKPYEYGSCQDRLSIINTPAGLFYISQNQGKIFSVGDGLIEISNRSIRWWLATYLPYAILKDFPDFALFANPVIGVGCQAIYDNENSLIYFTKKDYSLKKNLLDTVTYVSDDNFLVNGMLPIKLGDPNYFDDASWTLSYDPKMAKNNGWIGYHDWHPNLLIPGKNTFMSYSKIAADPNQINGIWIHNSRCDLYCNYYGYDKPFEIEFTAKYGVTVNTLRSVEYIMEVYKYADNCYDRFHVLDFNFDEAVVYNTEQCSGLLKLNLTPKNNAPMILNYPQINPTNIDILYSKEENKYRFNQFWDITDSRGEFPIGSAYPPPTPNPGTYATRTIFLTEANGYIRNLNPSNLNYTKNSLQRKKFRHYTVSVLLRRKVSGNNKILMIFADTKNLISPR